MAITKLEQLRAAMQKQGVDGFLVPTSDEFLNEFVPAYNQRLAWLTGFTGSNGIAAISSSRAALFTDGRYLLQAAQELEGSPYEILDLGEVTPIEWLMQSLQEHEVIGYDPKLFSWRQVQQMEKAIHLSKRQLRPLNRNPLDSVWQGRPEPDSDLIEVHEMRFAGESHFEKRRRVMQALKEKEMEGLLLTAPDSICWLLNIRGRDVPYTPIVLATAVLEVWEEVPHVALFIDPSRLNAEITEHLGEEVTVMPPGEIGTYLEKLGDEAYRIAYDAGETPAWYVQQAAKYRLELSELPNPVLRMKAVKNGIEQRGTVEAHLQDGVAVTKLLYWLQQEAPKGELTEIDIAKKAETLRSERPLFVQPSFETIAGFGPHGAIVHYRATPATNRSLRGSGLLLLDSGGQYRNGTTDITRTILLGEPTEEQRHRYTQVMKGHISLARSVFPVGTTGAQLDALARQYLWREGLDYAHGTGHGVGSFMGVHEGPQRISKRGGDAVLEPGMILSNEPGFYKEGSYGIRIESLVKVVPSDFDGYLRFLSLTCVPLEPALMVKDMLTKNEKAWLKDYHQWVLQELSPYLQEDENRWLRRVVQGVVE